MLISEFFAKGSRSYPDALAIADENNEFSYTEAYERIEQIAQQLSAIGVRRGSRVAIYSHNSASAYLTVLAIWRSGACYVSLNTRSTPAENAEMIVLAECNLLLCPESLCVSADAIAATAENAPLVVAFNGVGELIGCPSAPPQNKMLSSGSDLAWIVFTGGTTGRPKGVKLSHNALVAMTLAMQAHFKLPKEPVYLVAAPMTHAAGTLIPAVMGLGGCARFMADAAPRAIATATMRYRTDLLFLPPTLVYMILALPDLNAFDFSSLSHLVYAAAPMAQDKLIEAMAIFGPVMTQMYGQSEFPMMIAYMGPDEHADALANAPHRLSSCGRETMIAEIKITDIDGNIVTNGSVGELEVRGPAAMVGYLGEDTEQSGWIRTGDIARRDADGFIYLLDRRKDMIITGGFNVYSIEVESVILAHPAVAQCAVIGVPDPKWGEAVKAVVELKPGCDADSDELTALCKQQLGSVKAPKSVEIWPELPRNALGKILKREIREQFWHGHARRI